jgi:predicted acyltransferase
MAIGWLWDLVFPMNKSIWTSSYVLFTAGLALQFFGMCYWFIDIKGFTKWTKPFIIYGTNAITVFVLSGFLARMLGQIRFTLGSRGELVSLKAIIYDHLFVPYFSPINASLAFAITYILFWLAVMWVFYKNNVFLKV